MAYFPNGTASQYLDNQCGECLIPMDKPCPILYVQLTYNYEQFDEDGKPTKTSEVIDCLVNKKGDCQMKPLLDNHKSVENTLELLKKYNDETINNQ